MTTNQIVTGVGLILALALGSQTSAPTLQAGDTLVSWALCLRRSLWIPAIVICLK